MTNSPSALAQTERRDPPRLPSPNIARESNPLVPQAARANDAARGPLHLTDPQSGTILHITHVPQIHFRQDPHVYEQAWFDWGAIPIQVTPVGPLPASPGATSSSSGSPCSSEPPDGSPLPLPETHADPLKKKKIPPLKRAHTAPIELVKIN